MKPNKNKYLPVGAILVNKFDLPKWRCHELYCDGRSPMVIVGIHDLSFKGGSHSYLVLFADGSIHTNSVANPENNGDLPADSSFERIY